MEPVPSVSSDVPSSGTGGMEGGDEHHPVGVARTLAALEARETMLVRRIKLVRSRMFEVARVENPEEIGSGVYAR